MKGNWKERWIKRIAAISLSWFFGILWIQVGYAQEWKQFTYEGPIFLEGEEKKEPDQIIEHDGKMYHRISMELRDAKEEGILHYVSTSILYELEGSQEPPASAVVTLLDDRTGASYEREVFRKEVIEKEVLWESTFSFPLTVYGYDADTFILGDYEIPSNSSLSEYGPIFLETMGLFEDAYRIDRIEWIGESYEEEGILCRNAVAYGEKLIRQTEVVYGGQIQTPDRVGKQYVAVYEESIEETIEEIETSVEMIREETTQPQESISELEADMAGGIKQWLRAHVTRIVLSGLFFIGILFLIVLWRLPGKQKNGEAGD